MSFFAPVDLHIRATSHLLYRSFLIRMYGSPVTCLLCSLLKNLLVFLVQVQSIPVDWFLLSKVIDNFNSYRNSGMICMYYTYLLCPFPSRNTKWLASILVEPGCQKSSASTIRFLNSSEKTREKSSGAPSFTFFSVGISSFATVSDQRKLCASELSGPPWSWIRFSWGASLLRLLPFPLSLIKFTSIECIVFPRILISFESTTRNIAVCCTASLSSMLDTLSDSCVFVLVFGSLNSKHLPPHLDYPVLLNNNFISVDATSSLPLLSGLLGFKTFRFMLLSNLNRIFPGFVISCHFSISRRVWGVLFLLLIMSTVFLLHKGSNPAWIFFLFSAVISKLLVLSTREIRNSNNWYNSLCAFAREIFWLSVWTEFHRWIKFIG